MIGALMYNLASLKLIFIWAEFSLGKKEIVVMEAGGAGRAGPPADAAEN